jgi:hypothetical protein
MPNIWDGIDTGGDYVDGFPVPDEAQFTDADDYDSDTPKDGYAIKNHDFKVRSIRGTKNLTDYAGDTASVMNIRIEGVNGAFDGAGEPDAYWFKAHNFSDDNQYNMIAKKQVLGFAKMLTGMGLVTEDSFGEFVAATATPDEWVTVVNMLIDAAERYTGNYVFQGTVQWDRKWNPKHSKAFTNVRLYINKCPQTELPF